MDRICWQMVREHATMPGVPQLGNQILQRRYRIIARLMAMTAKIPMIARIRPPSLWRSVLPQTGQVSAFSSTGWLHLGQNIDLASWDKDGIIVLDIRASVNYFF